MSELHQSEAERIIEAVDGVRVAIDAIDLPDVTLRDLFAAVALHHLMRISPRTLREEGGDEDATEGEVVCREAYRWADGMLKARGG